MTVNFRIRAVAVGATATSMMVLAATAWACVGLASLTVKSDVVQPGGKIAVTGLEFTEGGPIQLHLDALTGPVLATVPALDKTMTSRFTVTVPLPADIQAGPHVLVATADTHGMNGGIPARATFSVGGAPAAAPASPARPAAVLVRSGPSVGWLVALGVGVAVGAVLLAGGLLTMIAGRGRNTQVAGVS